MGRETAAAPPRGVQSMVGFNVPEAPSAGAIPGAAGAAGAPPPKGGVTKKPRPKRIRRPKPKKEEKIRIALEAAKFDEGDLGSVPPPVVADDATAGKGKEKEAAKDEEEKDAADSSDDDEDADVDEAHEEALAEGRAAGLEFSKELYDSLTKEQLARYELYRRSALGRRTVNRVMASVVGATVPHQPTIVMAGLAKMMVGELIERARKVGSQMGHVGPVRPVHIREAYRQLRETRAPVNEFPLTTMRRGPPPLFR